MKVVLVAVPIANTRIPPLSLALLAGELKAHGHQVRCFDFNMDACQRVEPELQEYWKFYMGHHWNDTTSYTQIIQPQIIDRFIDQWVEMILAEKPDLIGISVNTQSVVRALSTRLKEQRPDLPIVLGGPTCSVIYGRIATRPSPWEDAVVSGEGEAALLELVAQWESDGKFQTTPGVVLFHEGNYIYGGPREPVKNPDQFAAADFSDFELAHYRDLDVNAATSLPVYSSRGCVAACAFCMDNPMWGNCWRPRSAQRVVAEMIHQADEHGITDFTFVDLVINGSARRLDEFAELLLQSGRNFSFWAPARIDRRLTLPLLQKLKKAGLRHLNFGLESGSDRVLRRMKKGYTAADARLCLQRMHQAGLTVSVNLITGFPGETWLDFLKTIWFVFCHRRLIWNRPGVTDCAAIPGSDLQQHPERYGICVELTANDAHYSWKSKDGRNTLAIRNWRKQMMNRVFNWMRFQEDNVR